MTAHLPQISPHQYLEDINSMKRFSAEARNMAALSHPCLVQIYEVGEAAGLHFIAMEYIEGENLSDLIGEKEIDINWILMIIKRVAEGLEYASVSV